MSPSEPVPARPSSTSAVEGLAAALNEAGLRMFRAADRGGNLALSPLSIGLALGMVAAGASGSVDRALRELFSYPAAGATLLSAFRSLGLATASEAGDGTPDATGETVDLPEVRISNSAWFDRSFTPRPAYVDTARTWFGARVETLPLRADPSGSRAQIDSWVSERTAGLIPRIMPEGLPHEDTVAVLVNTLYLKAQWWSPFDPHGTGEDDFHLADGTVTHAKLMGQALTASYARSDTCDAVVLPYAGDLEMLLVVPHAGRFTQVRDGLDSAAVAALDRDLVTGHVRVGLPRFSTTAKVDLREVIEDGLGVSGLFDAVGLDGIAPDLVLDAAVHATRVIVDEAGTEAAAATVVGVALTGMPIFDAEVIADRPFLYLVRDTITGAILIVGQYVDPRGA